MNSKELIKKSKSKKDKKILKKSSLTKISLPRAAWQVYVLGQEPKVKNLDIKNSKSWARIVGTLVEDNPKYYYSLPPEVQLSEHVVHKYLAGINSKIEAEDAAKQAGEKVQKELDRDKVFEDILAIIKVHPYVYNELPKYIFKDKGKINKLTQAISEALMYGDGEEITEETKTRKEAIINIIAETNKKIQDEFAKSNKVPAQNQTSKKSNSNKNTNGDLKESIKAAMKNLEAKPTQVKKRSKESKSDHVNSTATNEATGTTVNETSTPNVETSTSSGNGTGLNR